MPINLNNQNLELNIAYLYPRSMNIYGDRGNIASLINRSKWRNISVKVERVEVGQNFKQENYDLFFAGGGQDNSQLNVAKDLQGKKRQIFKAVKRNAVFLLICGTYQLFGHYFKTIDNNLIEGIGVLDIYTQATNLRMIGNVITKLNSDTYDLQPNTLVGFENHSGATYIKNITKTNFSKYTVALSKITKGYGNNNQDDYEGARYKNVFGTYLHGSLLPKNPHFTDYLIKLALENKYQKEIILEKLDDKIEFKAHDYVIKNR